MTPQGGAEPRPCLLFAVNGETSLHLVMPSGVDCLESFFGSKIEADPPTSVLKGGGVIRVLFRSDALGADVDLVRPNREAEALLSFESL